MGYIHCDVFARGSPTLWSFFSAGLLWKKMPSLLKPKLAGIFTQVEVSLLDKTEAFFKKKLEDNPCHPFEEIKPNVFVMSVKSGKFYGGVVFIISVILCTVIADLMSGAFSEFFVFPIVIITYSSCLVVCSFPRRTYLINSTEKFYEYYVGKQLIYKGHLHNCYIRLKGVSAGGSEIYYNVVINGYMMEEQVITSSSTRREKLGKLARKLAHKLEINYFDCFDKSREHVIRHRCPYRNYKPLVEIP